MNNERIDLVSSSKGLAAFWHFPTDKAWESAYDAAVMDRALPLHLKQIGDERDYAEAEWPYTDADSALCFDESGPFGRALRCNLGHIYAACPRATLNATAIDISGEQAFSFVAWIKFVGQRHLIAGIWDEGAWNKYGGERQYALFGGLFQQKGIISHVSATGAASFPQSDAPGAQYARLRGIDGQAFENDQWICAAMTYEPATQLLRTYLNGVLTEYAITDPVVQDVFAHAEVESSNPYHFNMPMYHPRRFCLKLHGYHTGDARDARPIGEHRLYFDLDNKTMRYEPFALPAASASDEIRLQISVNREKTVLAEWNEVLNPLRVYEMPCADVIQSGDILSIQAQRQDGDTWTNIGNRIEKTINDGAPFTIGRALGLGSDEKNHGSQIYIDGVAIFNRCLDQSELENIIFL